MAKPPIGAEIPPAMPVQGPDANTATAGAWPDELPPLDAFELASPPLPMPTPVASEFEREDEEADDFAELLLRLALWLVPVAVGLGLLIPVANAGPARKPAMASNMIVRTMNSLGCHYCKTIVFPAWLVRPLKSRIVPSSSGQPKIGLPQPL